MWHLSSGLGEVSWFDFTNAIIEIVNRKKINYLIEKPTIRAIDSDLLITPSKQPRYSAYHIQVENIKCKTSFWRNQLESCLSEI